MGKVWSVIALEGEPQYGGNVGYHDEPRLVYRYDSNVANHKRVIEGDTVVVRDGSVALGVARLIRITREPGIKTIQRCPVCKTTGIKRRRTKKPEWRCAKGHEFEYPVQSQEEVEQFAAEFGDTFVEIPPHLSVIALKDAALRPSDQLSIEELDPRRIEDLLAPLSGRATDLLSQSVMSSVPRPDEGSPDEGTKEKPKFSPSSVDKREQVLRSIRVRRGQQTFRKELIRRYGSSCMVTGCSVVDLLEAAHIWPYRSDDDNHPDNGLLLRADIHTLFDLHLMRIDPVKLTIHFDARVTDSGYADWDGGTLRTGRSKPSTDALKRRWSVLSND